MTQQACHPVESINTFGLFRTQPESGSTQDVTDFPACGWYRLVPAQRTSVKNLMQVKCQRRACVTGIIPEPVACINASHASQAMSTPLARRVYGDEVRRRFPGGVQYKAAENDVNYAAEDGFISSSRNGGSRLRNCCMNCFIASCSNCFMAKCSCFHCETWLCHCCPPLLSRADEKRNTVCNC